MCQKKFKMVLHIFAHNFLNFLSFEQVSTFIRSAKTSIFSTQKWLKLTILHVDVTVNKQENNENILSFVLLSW